MFAAPIPLHYVFAIDCNLAGIALRIDTFKSWFKRYEKAIAVLIAAVFLIIGLYFERDNIKQLGLPLSINDVVQALGQFATVGAFWVGFKQLKKANEQAKEQADKEQQIILTNAAQSQISKMSWALSQFTVAKLTFAGLCDFLSTMANLGGNFHSIYEDIREGPEKRVLRIAWQDMLWNELHLKLEQISVDALLSSFIPRIDRNPAHHNAQQMQIRHRYIDAFKEYYKAVNILKVCAPLLPSEVRNLLKADNSTFMLFRMYYFDQDYVGDYCKHLASQPNYRAHVPAIAALDYYFSNPRTHYLDDPDPV